MLGEKATARADTPLIIFATKILNFLPFEFAIYGKKKNAKKEPISALIFYSLHIFFWITKEQNWSQNTSKIALITVKRKVCHNCSLSIIMNTGTSRPCARGTSIILTKVLFQANVHACTIRIRTIKGGLDDKQRETHHQERINHILEGEDVVNALLETRIIPGIV